MATKRHVHGARRLLVVEHGQPISVELRMDPGFSPGTMVFSETYNRFTGAKFTSYVQGYTLVLERVQQQAGASTVRPSSVGCDYGGFASCEAKGSAQYIDLNELVYSRFRGTTPLMAKRARGHAILTVTVSPAGCDYAII